MLNHFNSQFLTQFIRFHGLLLVITISWILLLKRVYFANWIVFLYLIQSNLFLDIQCKDKFLLHSLFHQFLECLVIKTCLVCLYQSSSMIETYFPAVFSKVSWLQMLIMSIFPNLVIRLFTNTFFSLLFLTIVHFSLK